MTQLNHGLHGLPRIKKIATKRTKDSKRWHSQIKRDSGTSVVHHLLPIPNSSFPIPKWRPLAPPLLPMIGITA